MAVMIPEKPNIFHESSLEDVMFKALENLPEEYYVFHSFRITKLYPIQFMRVRQTLLFFMLRKEFFVLKQKQVLFLIRMADGYMETDSQ